ncbi:MAG TPA: glycoside hydrolase family 3 N-terminal domain-containing protein [Vicinamibacterales bacterium]|nr:glycoside hydrolase family 3 N-terminal domain-containing protein [Vicinamibacterales bacterium]
MLVQAQSVPLYKQAGAPIEQRVEDLLARMTLEEKFWQLFMIPGDLDNPANDYSRGIFGMQIRGRALPAGRVPGDELEQREGRDAPERINEIQKYFVEKTRLGIPIIPFEEAVHGLTQAGATMFPAAIALAATFDTKMMSTVASTIAAETRERGVRQVLSPVVNIADDVRWGRVEETYGEDPYLSSAMARAYVSAFEKAGIVTTPKHFVANVGEGGRDSYPVEHSERALAERYFPPFVAALEAGARSVMAAYNSVDGLPAHQNPRLMNEILKRDWGFKGFVISDASGTSGATVLHMTEPNTPTAAQHAWAAGLDVVFQSQYGQQRPYLDAVQRGLIPIATIDAAVRRVLRVKFELGLFERPYIPTALIGDKGTLNRVAALESAHESIVLLKNDRVLPLSRSIPTVAVIGVDADEGRLGGYSNPGKGTTILTSVRRMFTTRSTVNFAAGPGRTVREFDVVPASQLSSGPAEAPVPGLAGEYFDNPRLEGNPVLRRTDTRMDFRWTLNSPGRGIPFDWYSARWTGTITVPQAGVSRIGVEGNDGYRLYLDDKIIIDNWQKRSFSTRTVPLTLAPGSSHRIKLEYFETTGVARVKLIWNAGIIDDSSEKIAEAVEAAKKSNVAIIVAGIEEGEFRDRAKLGLPGRQAEMIEAVAATGRPTVVVLIGGSAITMPWLDKVGAVLHAWYPGVSGGIAVADILLGEVNPAGRLPITFPMSEGQLPLYYNHKPTGRGDDYVDQTGMALFPFGHGLSYTTFEYSDLVIEPAVIPPNGTATVRFKVRNTGARPGDEVAQLYIRDVLGSVARPVMELKGFDRIQLAPGEQKESRLTLGPNELRMLDWNMRWIVEPGVFRIMVGASSKDIRLRGELTVK